MPLFEKSTNIFENQIGNLFEKKKDTEMDLILKIVSLIVYSESVNTDLVELYRLLKLEDFVKVITLFDGRNIKLPTSGELKEFLVLSLVYYYRTVKNLSWEKIKEKFPFEISGISFGIKVKNLDNFIRQKINEYFRLLEKNKGEKNENI